MLGYIISDKEEINVEEHEIKSFDILHKTDLNIFVIENNKVLYINNIINIACSYGHIQVLEWFKNSGYEFKYDDWTISYYACEYGQVKVLEWFKNSGYEFKYNITAIGYACLNNHIKVLEWFKNSIYKFKYDEETIDEVIDAVISRGHIQVLEWFKNSGYEIKFNKRDITDASEEGHIQVLEWFKNSGYEFKYCRSVFRTKIIKILKFYSYNCNIKKLIKWSSNIFTKTIKFKANRKYLKGYQKN